MRTFIPYLKSTFLVLVTAIGAVAQGLKPDSSFVQMARSQAIDLYTQTTFKQAHVFEGNEYITHDHRIKIHPYNEVDSLQTGTILYNGVQYDNIRMQYDIVRDELAVQPPDGAYRIRLRSEYVSRFTIGPEQFIRINSDPLRPSGSIIDSTGNLPSGFYEILYDGRVKALSRRRKTVHEDISQGMYQADYLQKDRFFILKEGVYHEVKTKRAVLTLFPDQSGALRKYIRTNSLSFKEGKREEAITRLVRYYAELN